MLGARSQSSALPMIFAWTRVDHGEWRCLKAGTFALVEQL